MFDSNNVKFDNKEFDTFNTKFIKQIPQQSQLIRISDTERVDNMGLGIRSNCATLQLEYDKDERIAETRKICRSSRCHWEDVIQLVVGTTLLIYYRNTKKWLKRIFGEAIFDAARQQQHNSVGGEQMSIGDKHFFVLQAKVIQATMNLEVDNNR